MIPMTLALVSNHLRLVDIQFAHPGLCWPFPLQLPTCAAKGRFASFPTKL